MGNTKAQDRFEIISWILGLYLFIIFFAIVISDTVRDGFILGHMTVGILLIGAGVIVIWQAIHDRLGKQYE